MQIPRWTLRAAALCLSVIGGSLQLHAQGQTTGAISGTVVDAAGVAVEGATVRVVNKNNGFTSSTLTRANGLYVVPNLESGGPYTVTVRRIGFEQQERTGIVVSLSLTTKLDFKMAQQAVTLGGVQVVAASDVSDFSPTRQGVSTQVSDTLINHLPQLNRNITDMAKLVPQVITPPTGGVSAGGMYNRLNNYTVDGANQNDRFNLNSSGGIPGGAGGGRIISADAVKEFKVLMSPTDVRQANFTGMLFNAVTKSGTNEFHGGFMFNYRHDANMASANFRLTPVDQRQYGFTFGGPIIKDRLHFYIAPEWQRRFSGASGAYVGGIGSSLPNINSDSIALIQSIVTTKMGFDPGTSGRVDLKNPLKNLFGRLDFQINDQNRLVLRRLDNETDNTSFSRNTTTFTNTVTTQTTGFRLGSNGFDGVNKNSSNVAQLFSNFGNGISNEFLIGVNKISDARNIPTDKLTPEMAVGVVPVGVSSTTVSAGVTFGTEQFSVGNLATQNITEYQDNVSIPWGAHTFTVGARYETVKIFNNFPQALGGVWRFPNIAALNTLTPGGYAVGYANSGNNDDIPAVFKTNMPSAYFQDQWQHNNLTVTAGLRADMPRFVGSPLFNKAVTDSFVSGVTLRGTAEERSAGMSVNTTWMPKDRVYWSPRIGFNFDVNGDQTTQVRGNVGIFTGPPPFILIANALQNNGLGLVLLSCTAAGTIPAFTTDVNNLPKSCNNATTGLPNPTPVAGASGTNTININDPNFKYPQYMVLSGGADRKLPWGFVGTVEGIYKKSINGLRILDRNLLHPKMDAANNVVTDRNGRVLYADDISVGGTVTNTNQKAINFLNGPGAPAGTAATTFDQGVIYITNESDSYNYNLSGTLKRKFGRLDWVGAYTYTRAFDVQALTSDRAISNWRNGREYSTLENDNLATTSPFERRHRLITYGTITVPWTAKYSTDFTIFYEGISGFPVTFVSGLDLNGDGFAGNDPIYVPKSGCQTASCAPGSPFDTTEIRIGTLTGATSNAAGTFVADDAAGRAFDDFITKTECLNEQRGTIMKRASCRGPWQNRMDLSVRQMLPNLCGQGCNNVSLQLDIANLMNLGGELLQHLDGHARDWGKTYAPTLSSSFPQQTVLTATTAAQARTGGVYTQAQPVYTFNATARSRGAFDTQSGNGYNLALTLRYIY